MTRKSGKSQKVLVRKGDSTLTKSKCLGGRGLPLPMCTVQKTTSALFVDNHIKIRYQMKSGYEASNVRIEFMKNAPTRMLIMFPFILTAATTCKATVTYMYMQKCQAPSNLS